MITNFEALTKDLTADEKKLIPILVKILNRHKKNNPIKSSSICDEVNKNFIKHKLKDELVGVRLRKLTNFIRCNSILPLIATSKGYYVSYDNIEIDKQIKSLKDRAAAIIESANGLLYLKTKN